MVMGAAATYTWTGAAGNGLFYDGRNWANGQVPVNAPDAVIVYGDAGKGEILLPPGTGTIGGIVFTHKSGGYVFRCMTGGTTTVAVARLSDAAAITVPAGGSVEFGASVAFHFQGAQSVEVGDGGRLAFYGLVQGQADGNAMVKTGAGVLQIAGTVKGLAEISVGQGTVVVDAATGIDQTCAMTLAGGALSLAGGAVFPNDIVVKGESAPIGVHGGGTVVLDGTIVLSRDTVLDARSESRDGAIHIAGPVTQAAQTIARLTVSGPASVTLSGLNTYGGGTHVAGDGTLYFGAARAVPSVGAITAEPAGYVAATYAEGLQASLIERLSPGKFRGTLGFDTAGTVITEGIDLSRLSAYQGIGSKSSAVISGPITVAAGSPYLFGGGDGVLYIKSDLAGSGPAGVRVQSVFGSPLTVHLQGNNTFAGDVTARHANIILDSPGALPGDAKADGGARVWFDQAAYVGYTEKFSNNFNAFLNRIGAVSDPNAIVGIDASAGAGGRVISEAIDLSAGFTRADPYYLGTSSDVTLDGIVTPPGSEGVANALYLTAIRGGRLTVNSYIGGGPVSAVYIGQENPHDPSAGTVYINNSRNDYEGGTFVLGGILGVGADDSLGAGAVTVGAGATLHALSGVSIANRLVLEPGSTLSGGGEHTSRVAAGRGVTLDPGGPGATGTLHFHEGLALEAGSSINLDLRSASQFDRLCIWNGLQIVGSTYDPIVIKLYSIDGSGNPGAYAGFDPAQSHSWRFAYINRGALSIEGFDPAYFLIDGSGFSLWNNTGGGVFGIAMTADGMNLDITFTPVPEPGACALMALGIAMLSIFEVRRRRKGRGAE